MSKWKSIFAHRWDNIDPTGESLYTKAVKYLNGDKSVLNIFSYDSKRNFQKRMMLYSLDKTKSLKGMFFISFPILRTTGEFISATRFSLPTSTKPFL